jgi:hypothetical protein
LTELKPLRHEAAEPILKTKKKNCIKLSPSHAIYFSRPHVRF